MDNQGKPDIKACQRCGSAFECRHSVDCWCMQIKLDAEAIKHLRKNYTDCLCRECLEKYSVGKTG